ncbi:MAG: hypothetical protein QG610_107 [Euryarchaeota archaeon]|nr:hypothetical protein [Euryarchaeota archaeon]
MLSYLFQSLGFGVQVVEGIKKARSCWHETEGGGGFTLLRHLESTILSRFMTLLMLPVLGIGRLSELSRKEIDVCGVNINEVNYAYSTLSQFLGQMERVNAGEYLQQALCPGDRELVEGGIVLIYLDGHVKGYYTKRCMNVGKVTNKNKVMAGTKEVVVQNEDGHIMALREYPIDLHLVHVVLQMCLEFKRDGQKPIAIINREVNSLELGKAYTEEHIGLITILKKDQYKGVEDFSITHTYAESYRGCSICEAAWADKERCLSDPRRFVLVQDQKRGLKVFWCVAVNREEMDGVAIVSTYYHRWPVQEDIFKKMDEIDALNINYGRKVTKGENRNRKRHQGELAEQLEKKEQKLKAKEEDLAQAQQKLQEASATNQPKWHEARQRKVGVVTAEVKKAQDAKETMQKKLDEFGEIGTAYDRDLRKDWIMSLRSGILANLILWFMMNLWPQNTKRIGWGTLRDLLNHKGVMVTTSQEIRYLIEPYRSREDQENMERVCENFNTLNIQDSSSRLIRFEVKKRQNQKKTFEAHSAPCAPVGHIY